MKIPTVLIFTTTLLMMACGEENNNPSEADQPLLPDSLDQKLPHSRPYRNPDTLQKPNELPPLNTPQDYGDDNPDVEV